MFALPSFEISYSYKKTGSITSWSPIVITEGLNKEDSKIVEFIS